MWSLNTRVPVNAEPRGFVKQCPPLSCGTVQPISPHQVGGGGRWEKWRTVVLKVQTSSYNVNKPQGHNAQHGIVYLKGARRVNLKSSITRKNLHVMDANQTYCGDRFTVYF